METRKARVTGLFDLFDIMSTQGTFNGEILIEKREDQMRYEWRLQSDTGQFLALVSRGVSGRIIPSDAEPFEYALTQSIESIRKYRMGRKKRFKVNHWEWITKSVG